MAWWDHYDLYGDPKHKAEAIANYGKRREMTGVTKEIAAKRDQFDTPKPQPNVHSEAGLLGPYDVSSEAKRTYTYLDPVSKGTFTKVIIEPVKLWIKCKEGKTGSHRVLDATGEVHYMPEDWKFLTWTPKDGAPAVEF